MRVLWVSHFLLFPSRGFGALQRSRALLEELSKNNEVTLACLVSGGEFNKEKLLSESESDLKKYCREVLFFKKSFYGSFFQKVGAGIKLFFGLKPYSATLFDCPDLLEWISRNANKEKFDLVHVDTIGLVEHVLCDIDIPISLNHHNIESELVTRRGGNEKFPLNLILKREAKILENYEKKWCPQFAVNLVVSDRDKETLDALCKPSDIMIIPNPADLEYFNPKLVPDIKEEANRLVFVGSLDWGPNVDAVEYFCHSIWPLIKIKIPEMCLDIVGRHPSERVKKAVSLATDTTLLADVPDIRPIVKRAGIYICPLREGGGTRVKLIDACCMQKAIVSTTLGAEGLGLKDGVDLLIGDSPDDFADAVCKLYGDQTLRNTLGINSRELLEKTASRVRVGELLSSKYLEISNKSS